MALITLVEYAKRIGRSEVSVRHKVLRGYLKATKVGRDWLVDENEPYVDFRKRSSKARHPEDKGGS